MTTEQVRDLLKRLLAQHSAQQAGQPPGAVAPGERIGVIAAVGTGSLAVQFADGTPATITVTVTRGRS